MTELPPSLSPRPAGDAASPPVSPSSTPTPSQPTETGSPAADRPRVQRAEVGLTAPGVAVVVLAGSLVGLLIDAFTIDSGFIFGIAYVVSCVYAALQVRRRDLLAAVVVPPLVFFALTLGRTIIDPSTVINGFTDRALDLVSELATHAPALWAGTGLAAVIVAVRWRRGRTA